MWVSRESALLRAKPGEEAVKIVEMTVKDLESDMSVVIRQQQGWRGTTSTAKEVPWVECYRPASHAAEKAFVKGRVN